MIDAQQQGADVMTVFNDSCRIFFEQQKIDTALARPDSGLLLGPLRLSCAVHHHSGCARPCGHAWWNVPPKSSPKHNATQLSVHTKVIAKAQHGPETASKGQQIGIQGACNAKLQPASAVRASIFTLVVKVLL